MADMQVVRSGERSAWSALTDPPGERGSGGSELNVFASAGDAFTTGLWEREPDTWSFERPYDEVAVILSGRADIEEPDGAVHAIGPGDVLVTPKGTKGTWRIHETIVKFWAIYDPPDG